MRAGGEAPAGIRGIVFPKTDIRPAFVTYKMSEHKKTAEDITSAVDKLVLLIAVYISLVGIKICPSRNNGKNGGYPDEYLLGDEKDAVIG